MYKVTMNTMCIRSEICSYLLYVQVQNPYDKATLSEQRSGHVKTYNAVTREIV